MGEIGQVHVAGVRRARAGRLVAVADTEVALLRPFEADGVRTYRDAGMPGVDRRPAGRHRVGLPASPLALSRSVAGDPGWQERAGGKPLAIGLAECQELVDAAAAAGIALGVSHNQVIYGPHAEAKRLIDTGGIGKPVLIRLRLGMGPAWGGWRGSSALVGGGLLMDAGIHRLYLALYFFGPVRRVHAVLDAPRQQGEAFAVAILEFQCGALGIVEANHYGPLGTFDDEIEIIGSDAILRLAGIESLSVGYRTGPALVMFRDRQWSEVPLSEDDWETSVHASVAAYLDAVITNQEPLVTVAAALETMRLLHQIYDSAVILSDKARP